MDIASFACGVVGVVADLSTGVATGDGTDTLVGIEDLDGTPGVDTLIGDAGPNRLFGRAGNDSLSGLEEDDELIGGFQMDTGDGGPHVAGDICRLIEVAVNCELN